jgi:hypothetical protein
MNLLALKGEVSCMRCKLNEVRSVRKLFTVGVNTMNSKRYKKSTALKGGILNPTANKITEYTELRGYRTVRPSVCGREKALNSIKTPWLNSFEC